LRWLLLFGLWFGYFSFGAIIASIAPLVEAIRADLDISYAAIGSVMGAWQLVYIGAALPAGMLLDLLGARLALFLVIALIAASAVGRAYATGYWSLLGAVMLFGLGGPLISIGAPKLIALWFAGASRGMAMGIYMTGPALGGIAAYSSAHTLLVPLTGSWRGAFWVLAGAVLLAGLIWWAISRHPEARARDGKVQGLSKGDSLRAVLDIARLRTVQIVLLMSIGIFMLNHGLNNWLPEILRAKGLTAEEAGFWATIPTVIGILGALTIPRFATAPRRLAIMLVLFLAIGAATLLLHLLPGPGLVTGLVLQGIARSSMMTVAILLLMEAPGVPPERAGVAGGMFFTVAEIGGVLGPLSIGLVADASGGFAAPLVMLSCVALGLLVLLGWLRLIEIGLARRPASG